MSNIQFFLVAFSNLLSILLPAKVVKIFETQSLATIFLIFVQKVKFLMKSLIPRFYLANNKGS